MLSRRRLILWIGSFASAAFAAAGLVVTAQRWKLLPGGKRRRRPLPPEAAERIIPHMNKDHSASVLHYAKHFGRLPLANAASIVAIDYEGMELSVTTATDSSPILIRVDFKRPLKDPKDAKDVLVDMAKTAAKALGVSLDKDEEALLGLDPESDTTWGLAREEMGSKRLAGTVKRYDTHLFVIWKSPSDWPKNADSPEQTLPGAIAKALSDRKNSVVGKVKLNVAEGVDGDVEGSIICFPQEVVITGVTAETVGSVVDALLVERSIEDVAKVPGVEVVSQLPSHHVFVCAHIKRDKRCGLIGPYLQKELTRLIKEKGLHCPVRCCSHVGGHKYAGNVLAFSRRAPDGTVLGDWYGYVTPLAAKDIVDRTLVHGEILMSVWRGQMGLSEEDQENLAFELRRESCSNCTCHKTDL